MSREGPPRRGYPRNSSAGRAEGTGGVGGVGGVGAGLGRARTAAREALSAPVHARRPSVMEPAAVLNAYRAALQALGEIAAMSSSTSFAEGGGGETKG
jgi:hypothetical protein